MKQKSNSFYYLRNLKFYMKKDSKYIFKKAMFWEKIIETYITEAKRI